MQDARALELFNPLARIVEIAGKDLLVMLPEHRRAVTGWLGEAREVERKAGQVEASQDRIVNGGDCAALAKMRKLERLVGREHGPGGHAILGQTRSPAFVARPRRDTSPDDAKRRPQLC